MSDQGLPEPHMDEWYNKKALELAATKYGQDPDTCVVISAFADDDGVKRFKRLLPDHPAEIAIRNVRDKNGVPTALIIMLAKVATVVVMLRELGDYPVARSLEYPFPPGFVRIVRLGPPESRVTMVSAAAAKMILEQGPVLQ